jgi:hypothetical protein
MAETPEVQQAIEDLGRGFEEFKSTITEQVDTRATMEQVDVLVREKIERLQDTFDETTQIVERAGQDLKAAGLWPRRLS